MDEKRTDLKAELRELAAEESGGAGPHCGLKRLIDYREGTLPAAECEKVQEHLSLCPRCTGLLRELRAFEAAAAHGETGPESLRQEAWDSLARRLPAKTPAIRPVGSAAPSEPGRRFPRFVLGALAAALLLAVAGLSLWAATTVLQESQRTARLERRLEERNAALADLRSSLAETERQLDTARRQIEDLQKERTARAGGQAPEGREPVAVASRQIEVSVAPRYVLRGHEDPGSAFLRGGGVENRVRMPSRDHRFALALNLGALLHAGRKSGKQWHGRGFCEDPQARLCPGQPDPGCRCGSYSPR